MYPTVIGSEIEYCLLVRDAKGKLIDFFKQGEPECEKRRTEFILKGIPAGLRSDHLDFTVQDAPYRLKNTFFAENAARIYFDTGDHLEYAAAEALGARKAVTHQKAGDRTMEYAVARANERWGESHGFSFRLFKNNLAFLDRSARKLVSFGAHESYWALRNAHTSPDSLGAKFLPFLVSCLLFGNGWVWTDEKSRRLQYLLSQRATQIKELVAGGTTSGRPLINTRDEPHCGLLYEQYRRIHLIMGDSLTTDTALFLSLATKDMILDMIGSGFFPEHEYPAFAGGEKDEQKAVLEAMRVFNEDSSLRATVNLGGREYSIVNLQETYRDMAHKYLEETGRIAEPEVAEVFAVWNKVLALAKEPRPHEALKRYLEWAAKQWVIEKHMERIGCDWDTNPNQNLCRSELLKKGQGKRFADDSFFYHLKDLELKFHEQSPRGLANIMIGHEEIERMVPEEEIRAAIYRPCRGTRSYARSLQLEWLREIAEREGKIFKMDVDWEDIVARDDNGALEYSFNNYNPLSEDPRLPRHIS